MDVDRLATDFVGAVNAQARQRLYVEDCPPSVRCGEPDEDDFYLWEIKPADMEASVAALESDLGLAVPALFRSLLARFAYPAFDIGDIFLFANVPEQDLYYQMRDRIFSDRILSGALIENSCIQIGNPWESNYDPVCLRCGGKGKRLDAEIVVVDHEAILIYGEFKIREVLYDSVAEFMEVAKIMTSKR